jgi:small basic protein (TIGR04137 family)
VQPQGNSSAIKYWKSERVAMSMDRSLKAANALVRHRNVLTRTERLVKLAEEEKWNESKSVFGLPKVAHRKQAVGGKAAAKAAAEGTEAAAAGTAPAGAAPAAGAPAAKGAAPAAKGAAPAPAGKAAPAPAAKAAAPAKKK